MVSISFPAAESLGLWPPAAAPGWSRHLSQAGGIVSGLTLYPEARVPMTSEANTRALDALREMELLLEGHDGGYPAPELVREARALLRDIRWSGAGPGDVGMKLASIEGHLDVLFSERKHRAYARGGTSGATFVRQLIRSDVAVLRSILER